MDQAAHLVRGLLALALMAVCTGALALDFRSVRAPGAVLFDAPSQSARKLFILGAGYPVEVIVSVEGWHKVRDGTGSLAWIAAEQLSDDKRVMVTAARAAVRKAAADDAPTLFEAEQGVLLTLLEAASPGWLKVQHRDGTTGFVRVAQVWGG